jgi:hypothetical protein
VYIRWERRKRASADDHSLHAYLAESKRIEGSPRQRLKYLATIRDTRVRAPEHRVVFWEAILARFEHLDIKGDVLEKLSAAIEGKVPRPDESELSDVLIDWHRNHGWPLDELSQRYKPLLAL